MHFHLDPTANTVMAKEERTNQELPHSNDEAGFFRKRQVQQSVATSPFAGRIGGNQEFVVSEDASILKRQPDAVGDNGTYGLNIVLNVPHRHLSLAYGIQSTRTAFSYSIPGDRRLLKGLVMDTFGACTRSN